MKQPYVEVTITREKTGWNLVEYSQDFLELTGFSHDELLEQFQGDFVKMLSTVDMPAADELFAAPGGRTPLCPWIFTIKCAAKDCMLPILLQVVPGQHATDTLRVRIHDASFLGAQTAKMGRRIHALEKSIPGGLCQVLYDEYFTIIWHNDHFLKMLGYTDEQFTKELECHASGYVYPEDMGKITMLLEEATARGDRFFTAEIRVVRRDGEIRTLLTSMSFTEERVCGIPVLYSVVIDISQQKRAQELEADARRLQLAMDQASSYILEYEVRERRLLASISLKNYFGIDGDAENVPESLLASGVFTSESEQLMRDVYRQINEGAERAETTVCLRDPNKGGAESHFRIRITSIYDDSGRPAKAVVLVEDVTEQYAIELRYREEENRRVAMTYDMDFSAQFDLTKEKIVSAREDKFPFFDFRSSDSMRELVRRNANLIVHPDDREEYLRKLSREYMLELYGKGVPELTFEFRDCRVDGSYRWTRGLAHIIREPGRGHVCTYLYTQDVEEQKQRELELRQHAEQDALTGVFNRYTVELRCDALLALRKDDAISVLYMLDLDNFKFLNDTYGHLRGDDMLCQTADTLREVFGDGTVLGRLGGDEFVAFRPDCPSEEEAATLAQCLCDVLRARDAGEGVVTVSVGLAFAPKDGGTFAELYHSADDALYQAKRSGKNRWAAYHKEHTDDRSVERLPVSREWLLEESSDMVYVCDFFSYDLLYMNQGARERFGVGDANYIGRKCYEVLQHRDRPCEFCTNHLLCRESFHTWEYRSPLLGQSFLLKDRIVDWYGVPARIELATDVSMMDKRNWALEEQVKIDCAIIDCLRLLSGEHTLDVSAAPVLGRLAEFYGADRAFILYYDDENKLLYPKYEWERAGLRSIQKLLDDCGELPLEYMEESMLRGENYSVNLAEGEIRHFFYDAGITRQRCVPFFVGDLPAGMIGLDNPTAYEDEMTLLETLGYFVAEELSRSRLSDRLGFLGYHDSLTGLLNRNRYAEYQKELLDGRARSLGVAVADINSLKDINKLRGHAQGDQVVKRTANLLTESFPGAYIFRLSGDEFVVHAEDLSRAEFMEQVDRAEHNAHILQAKGLAIGYAWSDRDVDCAQLTMQATDVMLLRKREYYHINAASGSVGKHDNGGLQTLLDCIDNGFFKMYLQPKADCGLFSISGAEALARYQEPGQEVVSPDRFIPTLEQTHLVQYVDLFIFEEVCKLLARWQAEGQELLTISLNFSRQTALEPSLLKTILAITDRYAVPKDRIEVEITETLGDYESGTVAEIGAAIKSAGFRLALDDFGSHYTNMTMLSTVPVNVLKLDRSLVRDVMFSRSNQLVLKSIISLCDEMGISSVAEGVETTEQLELLRTLHCDAIQGYLFGRPAPVGEFEEKYLR